MAAVPMSETAFFYNPAHLVKSGDRPSISFIGLGTSVSRGVIDEYNYWRDELHPAIEEGLDEIRENDYDRLEALYDRALELGATQTTLSSVAYGPSVQLGVGDHVVGGIGAFGTNSFRLQFTDAGVGVPRVDAYDQLDVIVPLSVAASIPNTPMPIAVGATASYTRRYLTAKSALLESLDADNEHLYILGGSAVSVDLGAFAEDVVPGLDVGAVVYQLVGGDFDYSYESRIDVTGSNGQNDEAEIEMLQARFNERNSKPSLRIGAAYRIPFPAGFLPPAVSGTTVSADYVTASTSEFAQNTGARLHLGLGTNIGQVLAVRTGLSQGYPSIGASLKLPVFRLEYSFYGVEDGRSAGQLGRYNHYLQVRFGLF